MITKMATCESAVEVLANVFVGSQYRFGMVYRGEYWYGANAGNKFAHLFRRAEKHSALV